MIVKDQEGVMTIALTTRIMGGHEQSDLVPLKAGLSQKRSGHRTPPPISWTRETYYTFRRSGE